MHYQAHTALKVARLTDAANSLSCSSVVVISTSDRFVCDSELLKPQDCVLFVLSQEVGEESSLAKALAAKEGLQHQVSCDRNTRPVLRFKRFALTS
jgi:hypothetical protein